MKAKRITLFLSALLMTAALVGCAGTPKDNTTPPSSDPGAQQSSDPAQQSSDPGSSTDKYDAIKAAGKIIVGTESKYAPYEFHILVDGKDQIVGFDMDIAKEIAKDLGVEMVLEDMEFDALIPAIQMGNIDISLAGINPDDERRKACDFSDVYYEATQLVLVRKADEAKYTTIESLKGQKVGAQSGAIQEKIVNTQMPESVPNIMQAVPTLVLELVTGNIEAVVIEGPVAEQYVRVNNSDKDEKNDLAVVALPFDESAYNGGSAVMLGKGSPKLVEAINQTLKRLKDSGELKKFIDNAFELQAQSVEE